MSRVKRILPAFGFWPMLDGSPTCGHPQDASASANHPAQDTPAPQPMKKILQVFSGGTTSSGVTSYLCRQYRHAARSRIRYDFFACKENSMALVVDAPVSAESRVPAFPPPCGMPVATSSKEPGMSWIFMKKRASSPFPGQEHSR